MSVPFTTLAGVLSDVGLRRHKLKVEYFRGWHSELDAALRVLPATLHCPPDLFQLLATERNGQRKRVALVLDSGTPVAVAAIRKASRTIWQPVTHYILPGIQFPVQHGRLYEAAAALGVNVRMALWRSDETAPAGRRMKGLTSATTYGVNCSDDFELIWKQSGLWKTLCNARNRCKELEFGVNLPGSAEWIIRQAAQKWSEDPGETSDRIIAARYLQDQGILHSLTLSKNGSLVAGSTWLIHRNEAVAQKVYLDAEFKHYRAGHHLFRLAFDWARDSGLSAVDLGGGDFDYKRRFALPKGEKHELIVCAPLIQHYIESASKTVANTAKLWLNSNQKRSVDDLIYLAAFATGGV